MLLSYLARIARSARRGAMALKPESGARLGWPNQFVKHRLAASARTSPIAAPNGAVVAAPYRTTPVGHVQATGSCEARADMDVVE